MITPDVVKIVVAVLMFALRLFSMEINVVPTGGKILLLSSKRIASQLPFAIADDVMESVHSICQRYNRALVRFEQISITQDEITDGYYIAYKQNASTNDLAWYKKKFKLHHYESQPVEIERLKNAENYGYKLAGGLLVFLGGATAGVSTFAPKEISLMMGGFSLSLSLLTGAYALAARHQRQALVDRCPPEEEPQYVALQDEGVIDVDVDKPLPAPKPQYALPILASELWCQ